MVQRRGGLRLLQKPLLRRVVAGQIRRHDLDRHLAVEARVLGRGDDAIPPWSSSARIAYGPSVAPGVRDMGEAGLYTRILWSATVGRTNHTASRPRRLPHAWRCPRRNSTHALTDGLTPNGPHLTPPVRNAARVGRGDFRSPGCGAAAGWCPVPRVDSQR